MRENSLFVEILQPTTDERMREIKHLGLLLYECLNRGHRHQWLGMEQRQANITYCLMGAYLIPCLAPTLINKPMALKQKTRSEAKYPNTEEHIEKLYREEISRIQTAGNCARQMTEFEKTREKLKEGSYRLKESYKE